MDEMGSVYLAALRQSVYEQQGYVLIPLNTTGDGSCLLHACSRAIWGVELFSGILRNKVAEELKTHKAWYGEHVGEADCETAIKQAEAESEYLSMLHIVALSHVIRRPIILYASQTDVDQFGTGFWGVAGVFVPLRCCLIIAHTSIYGNNH